MLTITKRHHILIRLLIFASNYAYSVITTAREWNWNITIIEKPLFSINLQHLIQRGDFLYFCSPFWKGWLRYLHELVQMYCQLQDKKCKMEYANTVAFLQKIYSLPLSLFLWTQAKYKLTLCKKYQAKVDNFGSFVGLSRRQRLTVSVSHWFLSQWNY